MQAVAELAPDCGVITAARATATSVESDVKHVIRRDVAPTLQ
jgi:hypothetical protein